MKYLIFRLILTVSLPIILGVGVVLSIFYQLLWQALNQWQFDSANWVEQTQKQVLYNSIYSQQILLEYSFNQLELHMVVIKNMLNNYQSGQMLYNHQTTYLLCSYREYMLNQCPQNVYDQINRSIFYTQLYFVRSIFKYDLLPPEQQYFIKMNQDLSFYGRAAFLAAQQSGIIQINSIHDADTTATYTVNPSVLYNYTQSTYYTCEGTQYIEPYDPRCRFWYQYAKQNEGMFIYQPYNDALTGALQMSISTQILKDYQFYSVGAIIFKMQNIVNIFNSYLSENSYTVLFHEFDATVFYHPLLIYYQTTTWADVEFLNINQFCNNSNEEMDICLSQKQQFMSKLNQTIQFIKTGNYQIDSQTNLDQLYSSWERFGQKQMSIVFPIQSKLKGINTQKPYSYAILLLARVITDNSDQLKLFNILNTNIIKAYLLIGFALLSIIILIFISNYGFFLVFQIQNPIEMLIIFLEKSYLEQLTYQTSGNQNKIEIQIQQKIQKKFKQIKNRPSLSFKSAQKLNLFQKFWQNSNKINKNNNQIQKQHQLQDSSIFQSQNLTISNQQSQSLKNQIRFQRSI
ncbi:tetratricopeptide repeat protein (macronuclear) [Tetrahymena thermophila SB210]|uniref:Tetratricopeptide repeat protein n=1 Tax=Tetrahymena thermophila (strain SB210) TaxID=312017 RepID=W7X383_TETTS|nr:tetratricopeptide repeat protein [Tetrahymena thermophila SB210]EWS71902.1 tetratricopeptide repeat protein [Tetrahymena thermophila SB210]|eukprot:XP_012655559.1 tetratricopeptide repeat protein [Tetrahymena thermophila SB210]